MSEKLRFSQRYGFEKVEDVLQINSMNESLKTCLWNVFYNTYILGLKKEFNEYRSFQDYFTVIAFDLFYKKPVDEVPGDLYYIEKFYKEWWFKTAEWCKIYDFFEFYISHLKKIRFIAGAEKICKALNDILEREKSGYRFINDKFVPITDKNEIDSIEEALNNDAKNERIHLSKALYLLSDKSNPDYRNSIKESISAVEYVVREMTGASTLGNGLKELETKEVIIPQTLQKAFEKLYAYTNDEKTGIRHALIGDENILFFEEAKFMLVACSAFVNYLKLKKVNNSFRK